MKIIKSFICFIIFFHLILASCGSEKEKKGFAVYDGILMLANNNTQYFSYCRQLLEMIKTGNDSLSKEHFESFYQIELPQIHTIYDNLMVCSRILKDIDSSFAQKVWLGFPRIRDKIFRFSWFYNDSASNTVLDSLLFHLKRGENMAQEIYTAFKKIDNIQIVLKK